MTRPAGARISLPALQYNYQQVRKAALHSRVMAIIKANAYGHGLISIAQALHDADAFGVVSLDEAISLREAGFDRRIVLLEGLFGPSDLGLINAYRLDVVVHRTGQVELLEAGRVTRPLAVWLKIDTGMHRLGFQPVEVAAVTERLGNIAMIDSIRFFSHFARADERDEDYTIEQLGVFNRTLADLEGERSLANSAAVLAWPDAHFDWVRPGIMLYGASPLQGRTASELDLQPVMTLGTQLIAIHHCRSGDCVGYGGDWVCPEAMDIGIAAIGYGDGYPRHAHSGTPVLVNGRQAALIGRVSMDMICIDLRNHPEARVGDGVVLWGEGLPVEVIADAAGTLSYELLSGISSRVHMEYHS